MAAVVYHEVQGNMYIAMEPSAVGLEEAADNPCGIPFHKLSSL